jgi:hypothetical protein
LILPTFSRRLCFVERLRLGATCTIRYRLTSSPRTTHGYTQHHRHRRPQRPVSPVYHHIPQLKCTHLHIQSLIQPSNHHLASNFFFLVYHLFKLFNNSFDGELLGFSNLYNAGVGMDTHRILYIVWRWECCNLMFPVHVLCTVAFASRTFRCVSSVSQIVTRNDRI